MVARRRKSKVDAQSIKVLRAKAGLSQDKFAALYRRSEIGNNDGVNRPGRRRP
jgi:DNA-binding transcriptional regulator YiaG